MSSPRITSSMIHRGVLADLNEIATKVSRTQLKLSSGKEILRPSDDPFGTGRALGLRTELDGLGAVPPQRRRRRGLDDGDRHRPRDDRRHRPARPRAAAARRDRHAPRPSERGKVADEIDQLIAAAKDTGNSNYAGRSLFARHGDRDEALRHGDRTPTSATAATSSARSAPACP